LCEFGTIHKSILDRFDISGSVFHAEIYWDRVLKYIEGHKITYKGIPKYPEVRRDLALLLKKDVQYKQIRTIAWKTEKNLLKHIRLFDVYEGDKIDSDKKSYAISFTLQDEQKTLTDQQIDDVMNRLMKAFEKELGAQIRS